MAQLRRSAVFTALSGTIGHELVFKHYTNKVVAAKYPDIKKVKPRANYKRPKGTK